MELPNDFQISVYRNIHTDLKEMTDKECIQHYLKHGQKEGRAYTTRPTFKIFIYCSGKCGSSTLLNTCQSFQPSCFHVHDNYDYLHYAPYQYMEYKSVFELIEASANTHEKIYIIDSYRTPIERKISSFFENIANHVGNYKELSIEELIHIFNDKFLNTLEEYHSIHEVLQHFQIPFFTAFDYERGYNIVEYKNIVCIKLRFKDIGNWSNILSKIFNRPICLKNSNLTEQKEIFEIYTKFKSLYKVDKKYLESMLQNDEEFKIYNNEEERSTYANEWFKKCI